MAKEQLKFRSEARDKILRSAGAVGFNAATGEYMNLIHAGIIDPTKVVRVALENAVSVAGVLLLTEATLTEIPEPKEHGPGLGGGGFPSE